jgi:hypothetical protein
MSAVRTLYGDPGVTLSIAIYTGASITATANGTVSTEVSAIVASANVSYSISLAVTLTAGVTYTGSWTVPSGYTRQGYIGAGAFADRMAWSYGHYGGTGGCTWIYDRWGTLQAPYRFPDIWVGEA